MTRNRPGFSNKFSNFTREPRSPGVLTRIHLRNAPILCTAILVVAIFFNLAARCAAGTVFGWGGNGVSPVPPGLTNIAAISAKWANAMALYPSGSAIAWGDNSNGRTNLSPTLTNIVKISQGGAGLCLSLKSDGTVLEGPWAVPTGLSNIVDIAAGFSQALVLKSDGTVFGWGYRGPDYVDVPAGLTNVVAITAGQALVALRVDGTLAAWGYDAYNDQAIPSGLSNVVAISGGNYHTLALKSDGTVVAWGFNGYGQCNVPSDLNDAVAIAAGDSESYALRSDGTIVGWGCNDSGQMDIPVGLTNVVAMAAGMGTIVLLDKPAPTVQIAPLSRTASLGSDVPLYVVATGFPPLHYQWYKGGVPIAGATSSAFVLVNAQVTNAGAYSVVVSNSFGQTRSTAAMLSLPPPHIMVQPRSQVGYWGLSTSFRITVVGTEPLNYQWYFNGSPISWGTNASFNLEDLNLDAGGQYYVTVSNEYGTETSDPATLIVNPASVSPGLYFGLTITGAVGKQFGIQYVTSVGLTNSWTTVTNITLTQPSQLWVDTNVDVMTPPRRFYRVVAIP
jgi:hypothetical protein